MSKLQQRNNKTRNGSSKNKTNSKRSGSNYGKSSEPFDTNNKRESRGKGSNDPSWYSTDPALLRDSASFPYSWPMGTPINFHNSFLSETGYTTEYHVPGICSLYIAPSVGNSADSTSAVNIAATAMYAYVRHANSGHSNYEAADLMLYVLSMTQIYSYINFLQRAYGCATLYAQRNRYLPESLLTSMRISADSLNSNLANFRYGINVLINRAASLAVPANMTIFARHAFLYQNVYTEGASVKDQMYLYNPDGFWWFDVDTAGKLTYVPFRVKVLDDTKAKNALFTYEDLLEYGNKMLERIIGDEDMNIMSGDILKAYGGNILQLQTLPEYYPLVPVYNIGVLEQIQNATVLDMNLANQMTASGALDVTQELGIDKSYLVSLPNIEISMTDVTDKPNTLDKAVNALNFYSLALTMGDKLITTESSDVTPELTMENTRLTVSFAKHNSSTSTKLVIQPITGTEVVMDAAIICMPTKVWIERKPWDNWYATINHITSSVLLAEVIQPATYADQFMLDEAQKLISSMAFKFIPLGMIGDLTLDPAASPKLGFQGIRGQLANYTVITHQELSKLHEAALMNELAVPSIGKFRG